MRFIIFLFLPPGSVSVARLSEKQVINLVWPKCSTGSSSLYKYVHPRGLKGQVETESWYGMRKLNQEMVVNALGFASLAI